MNVIHVMKGMSQDETRRGDDTDNPNEDDTGVDSRQSNKRNDLNVSESIDGNHSINHLMCCSTQTSLCQGIAIDEIFRFVIGQWYRTAPPCLHSAFSSWSNAIGGRVKITMGESAVNKIQSGTQSKN